MKKVFVYLVIITVAIFAASYLYNRFFSVKKTDISNQSMPNIILIMGDDIGYSDIGPYGSEIQTPNLDRLADEGIRFTNFYNMSKCEPSRSSLFTGLYEGGKNALNFTQILKDQGYYIIHSGKEHWMKWAPEHLFAKNIAHQSLTFEAMNEFFEPPSGIFTKPFILNGDTVGVSGIFHKKTPFFKTDALTDNAIRWLEEPVSKNQPFFLFMGYGAAHYPLQARPEDIAKYRGTYMKGWDKIREDRTERLKQLGLLSESVRLSPPSANINKFRGHPDGDNEIRSKIPLYRPWSSLDEAEKDELDLEMAVFAAMVDRMDQNIGRILEYLDEKGLAENTMVIFLSDNGSCPYDSNRDFDYPPGVAEGFRTLCASWANAGNTPFRYFKQYGHEGGANTHCIVRWPGHVEPGTITRQTGHITDLAPTLLDAAGIPFPEKSGDIVPQPFQGSTLLPVLEGNQRQEPDFFISGWTDRFRMYREKNWKIVNVNGESWELYNLNDDPTEIYNLADSLPEKAAALADQYMKTHERLKGEAKQDISNQ